MHPEIVRFLRHYLNHSSDVKTSDHIWSAALLAGTTGLLFIILFQGLLGRMIRLPAQSTPDLSHIPLLTLFSLVIMGALVAGIAEEVA